MKHITKYFALAGALMLFSSCNDFLATLPKGKVIPTTVEDFGNLMKDMTLSTAYDGLPYYCSDDVLIPNRSINMSNATNKAYFWLESFYLDSEDDQNWNDTYNHLFTINVVLENIEGATGGTEEERRRIAAEAKIFRAYNYWYLQSLYGPAYNAATASTDLSVPLVTEPNLEAKHSRATVEQVTAQILKNLEGIEQDLPIMGSNNYKPTRAAAYAMKARVLFYLGRYDEARKEAEKALELNNKIDDMREWSFPPEFPSGSINGKPTDITSLQKIWYHSVNGSGALSQVAIGEGLLELYKKNGKDLRFKFWFSNVDNKGEFFYDENTYCYIQTTPNYNIGVPEMMLIKAEALARQNDPAALDILNELRKYRFTEEDYTALTAEDGNSLLEIVLEERRRELALSGLRWFDMKRLVQDGIYTQTLTRTSPDGETHTLAPGSNRYLFPIPQSVILQNGNIVQNPR